MLIKTILNRIERQPGFVYGAMRLRQAEERLILEVEIRPQARSQAICSGCGERRPGYDVLPQRRFDLGAVPLISHVGVSCRRMVGRSASSGGLMGKSLRRHFLEDKRQEVLYWVMQKPHGKGRCDAKNGFC